MAAERDPYSLSLSLPVTSPHSAQLLGASVVSLTLQKHFGSPVERCQDRQGVIILFFPGLQCAGRPAEAAQTFSTESERVQGMEGESRQAEVEAWREGRRPGLSVSG